jgi:Leucine-rich repeat (LRR) protein
MCILSKIHFTTFLLISTFAISSNVLAIECFEKSPNLITLKDDYYNLENSRVLTNNEIEKLNEIYDNISGRWEGEVIISECTGPDNAPVVNVQTSSLTADISTNSSGRLLIGAELNNTINNITGGRSLDLLNNSNIMEITFISKNNFTFTEKFRLSNVNRGSRLIEHIFGVKRNGDSLSINLSVFINGIFVTHEAWSLTKK